jgi:hypothetical protein
MPASSLTIPYAVERLNRQASVIAALVTGVGPDQAHWKPSPEDWSIVEVINHLYDEERDDFRLRFEFTLHRPAADWPPIHPSQWAIDRRYNERDLDESLRNFLGEREQSLAWLRDLPPENLATEHVHPDFGGISAGDLLAAWVAHDCLHIRQLNELQYLYHEQYARPYQVGYAGEW